jgi:hypothetical protein
MFAVMNIFLTDFIFDIWLWHGDLYRVSPFQVYCTSTSCLPCDLEFFMFAVMKIFLTDISASTGRNDFIFDIWLWHGDLYRVSHYTPTRREGAILQSPCPSVRPFVRQFTLSLKMSQLLLEEMILFLIHDFGIVTCTVSPLSRLTAHILPVYRVT